MCGIVGYTGRKQCVQMLLSGLGKLEYRGYDSAGIAVLDAGGDIADWLDDPARIPPAMARAP